MNLLTVWSKNIHLILRGLSEQERIHNNQNINRDRPEEAEGLKKNIRVLINGFRDLDGETVFMNWETQ